MSPSKAGYEAFLIKNISTISSLESSLRSLTWFLPGRFKDAELASEALSASLNVISLYHGTLLAKVVQGDPNYKSLLPSSFHARFTREWSNKAPQYKWAARALELIRFTELVVEMVLRRKVSATNRWRGVVVLEVIKALLRLVLLKVTRRPLLSPPIPERDFDPTPLPPSSSNTSPTLAPSSPPSSPPATPEHLRNNHVPLFLHPLLNPPPAAQSDTSVEDFLLSKALTTTSVRPPAALVRSLSSPKDWISETIYILRPLVYVSLLTQNRNSSRSLVVALVMEVLSRQLRRAPPPSATLERAEYARRDKDMFWYLLRGSIWRSYTRPKLEAFAKRTHTPVLGLFSAFVKEWVPLVDEYYYYTAP